MCQCLRCLEKVAEAPHIEARLEGRDIAWSSGKQWFGPISRRIDEVTGLVRVAGYSGLVLLFDEVETVATLLRSIRQRLLSYEFMDLLISPLAHANCLFAFATTPDFAGRVASDEVERRGYVSQYPAGYRFIAKWQEGAIDRVQLRHLKMADWVALCRHLREIHEEAYGWSVGGRLSDDALRVFVNETARLNMENRDVVKVFVHLLEVAEQHGGADVGAMLRGDVRRAVAP